MHIAQHVIAVADLLNNNAESIEIVYLVKLLVLIEHFAVDTVFMLYPSGHAGLDTLGGKLILYAAAYLLENIVIRN